MNANELMIGDWVSYNDKMSCKITALCKDRPVFDTLLGYQDWSVPYEKLTPIPLTPEILEQNGFVKQDYDGWQISEDNGRGLIEYRTDYFDGFLIISYIKKPFSKISVKLKHVHELQHALRLCGIDKEIIL